MHVTVVLACVIFQTTKHCKIIICYCLSGLATRTYHLKHLSIISKRANAFLCAQRSYQIYLHNFLQLKKHQKRTNVCICPISHVCFETCEILFCCCNVSLHNLHSLPVNLIYHEVEYSQNICFKAHPTVMPSMHMDCLRIIVSLKM